VIALSTILSQTRALGLTDRHGLAASFTIARHHYPETRQVVREPRVSDATFGSCSGPTTSSTRCWRWPAFPGE
jgi:hypothetical protein